MRLPSGIGRNAYPKEDQTKRTVDERDAKLATLTAERDRLREELERISMVCCEDHDNDCGACRENLSIARSALVPEPQP
jgi:hypothetical protein